MAYVYLIGQNGDSDYYKIGSTRASDLNKRIKQLQTGNSNQLYLKHSFQTDTPFKLERMLHFYYNQSFSIVHKRHIEQRFYTLSFSVKATQK